MRRKPLEGPFAAVPTLVHVLRRRAVEDGGRPACSFLSEPSVVSQRLNYEELDRQARRVAACLQRIESPGPALLIYPPGLDFTVGFLGCLYAGTIAIPAELPRLSRNSTRLESVIKDAQPKIILTVASIAASRGRLDRSTRYLDEAELIATDDLPDGLEDDWSENNPCPNDAAMIQYTSGSTGRPRGVVITHANIAQNSEFIRRSFKHTSQSHALSWLPHFHDMGLMGTILHPLYSGFPFTSMSPLAVLQRPVRWLQAMSITQATTSGGPNFAYELCLRRILADDRKELDLSRWEVAFNGSEPVRAETLDRFADAFQACGFRREAFFPCYGLAEATLLVSAGSKSLPPVIHDRPKVLSDAFPNTSFAREIGSDPRMVSCGETARDHMVAIVDPRSRMPCDEGQVGEIWFSGPSVAAGYWNRPDDTNETFRASLAEPDRRRFLRTGDLGVMRHGQLYITGRLKDIIIIAGLNHYPEDIERTVEQSDSQIGVGCCAGFPVVMDGEEQLVLAVELERRSWMKIFRERKPKKLTARWRQVRRKAQPSTYSASSAAERELGGNIREAVARTHGIRAHAIVLLPPGALPRTTSGKIQRRTCREAYLNGDFARLIDAPWPRAKRSGAASELKIEGLL